MQASTDKILFLLKTRGPLGAGTIGECLEMTSMGARQHLQQLEVEGWVSWYEEVRGRGRPSRLWKLTEKAWSKFPDTHAELTVQLIDGIKNLFGADGLQQVVEHRELQTLSHYQAQLSQLKTTEEKLIKLVELRTQEGYMADWQKQADASWLFWENHCPICAAAKVCQGFCQSELDQFSQLLEPAQVSREQHLLKGDFRCVYRITSTEKVSRFTP